MALLENNDCDLVCKGCELEADPMKCIDYFIQDVIEVAKQNTEEREKEKAENESN